MLASEAGASTASGIWMVKPAGVSVPVDGGMAGFGYCVHLSATATGAISEGALCGVDAAVAIGATRASARPVTQATTPTARRCILLTLNLLADIVGRSMWDTSSLSPLC